MRKETWKNATYPNARPCWQKHRSKFKEPTKTRMQKMVARVLATLDYDYLATLGKE